MIIYDALRSGPIVRLDVCDVLPVEAIYAHVEVKTRLDSRRDIRAILDQASNLRSMLSRIYCGPDPSNKIAGWYKGTSRE